MPDDPYITVMGSVYKVEDVTRKGRDCRSVRMKAINVPRKGIEEPWFWLTIWPDHEETKIAANDFLIAGGYFSKSTSDQGGDDFNNLSVQQLWNLGNPAHKQEVETSSRRSSAPPEDDDIPF